MKQFKGTLGEHHISKLATCAEVSGNLIVISCNGYNTAYVPAWTDDDDDAFEARSNAQLYATSPELLEALQRCESALRNIPLPVEFVNDLLNARAAIAKALGE